MQHAVKDIVKVQINQAAFFKNLYRSLNCFVVSCLEVLKYHKHKLLMAALM